MEPTSEIALVVAAARNGVIGRQGQLPWRLRDDMVLFKRLTMGHPIIMGRKTFESLGKPLPGRANIVISRSAKQDDSSVTIWVANLDEAIKAAQKAGGPERICIIGGGEIYRQALPLADVIYLTKLDEDIDGDTYFPYLEPDDWRVLEEHAYPADERNEYGFYFQKLVRSKKNTSVQASVLPL